MYKDLAIISGAGRLPLLLQSKLPSARYVVFKGVSHLLQSENLISAKFEKLGVLFEKLRELNIKRLMFAGAMSRPSLNFEEFDPFMQSISMHIAKMLQQGDDRLFRFTIELFVQQGFKVISVADAIPELFAAEGMIVRGWHDKYHSDLVRADQLLSLTSSADIGQATVVEAGMVLGLETLQGTDALLAFVAATKRHLRHSTNKGILVKRPKHGQEMRIDLPSIGPDTIENVAKAGLAGIVISPNSVILIEREELVSRAKELGIFIQALEPKV